VKKVTIYTDGSCSISSGDGGYGALLIYKRHTKEICGGIPHTTSNRMELTAVIKALQELKDPCEVIIYSDSLYVVNAFRKNWIETWIKKQFRNIKNSDLWISLLGETRRHKVTFQWIKGHNGTPGNVRADELADIGRQLSNDSKKGIN
jgi:ribonuclease HI